MSDGGQAGDGSGSGKQRDGPTTGRPDGRPLVSEVVGGGSARSTDGGEARCYVTSRRIRLSDGAVIGFSGVAVECNKVAAATDQ